MRHMEVCVRGIFAALLALTWSAHAAPVSCDVIDAADSITVKCPKAASQVPVVPVVPVDPTPPTDPAPPVRVCPLGMSAFLCSYWLSNPLGTGGSAAPAGDGGGYDRLVFDFRDGDILRIVGSGTRTAIARYNARISFSVGDSGGNKALTWQVLVTVNGRTEYEGMGVYQVTPAILVHTGDVVAITIRGDGVVASARLAIVQ